MLVLESSTGRFRDSAHFGDQGRPQQDLPIPDGYSSHLGTTCDLSAPSITSHRQFTFGEQFDQHHGVLQFISDTLSSHTSSQQELPFGLVPLEDQPQTPYKASEPYMYAANTQNHSMAPLVNGLQIPSLPAPNLSVKTLAPARTYSFDETTLGRRIARATAEFAVQVLTKFDYPLPVRISVIFLPVWLFLCHTTASCSLESFRV